jgi:NADH-quinone oxidoreductase subunit F
MKRISSLNEFSDLRHRIQSEREIQYDKPTVVVCAGTGGLASGSNDVIRVIKRYIIDHSLQERIGLRITGCQGFCEMDPFVVIEPGRQLYPKLKMEDVPRIIEAAVHGHIDEELIYKEPREYQSCHTQEDIPFFKMQTRTILGNNQKLDPIRIFDYIGQGGYAAFEKALLSNDPESIVNEVKKSGLRGRGGAGFPTGRKWELARAAGKKGEQKYIVCNCDEGDPGAYMDRSLLEGNPHCITEGMMIAGIAIGATKGFIYVRTEYPLAIKHTLIALRQARELGILGENILGTGVDFEIEIVRGAGAFVCGEETALIKSIEGRMGEPRQRPPYPIEKGIWGHPTCINNVETLANIPVIINHGGEEFTKVGVPGNTGTKIFSLVGKIKNTGLVEVPLGMKISQVVHDIGGGPVGSARIKAVQTGGPSGGCIPSSMFDLPIDYDSLAQAGSIMGSGGMIVMDDNTCMVDVAKYFMNFLKDESCGKCFSCRKGTQRMHEILEDVTKGKATLADLDLLEELAEVVKDTTMCGLGQTASNPVLSTLKYFKNEYVRHIWNKKCDAFVCRDLVGSPCQSACPIGTEAWRYVAHLARGEYEEAYRVIRESNPFPSVCARVCDHTCEAHCKLGTTGDRPVAIRALKRFITDNVDPSTYKLVRVIRADKASPKVAIVGSGPAGLTAAHYLSLEGYKVTVYESEKSPGGMLTCGIPAYRLPRKIIQKEIESLLDENITLQCSKSLGEDMTIDSLFESGFKAVFLAVGAHKSRKLNIEGEGVSGVHPAIKYLKDYNLRGKNAARGRVGVIGGGDSAVDAARVALRQQGVQSVTILYRRTRQEMPALAGEVDAAIDEGVKFETLVSPLKILSKNGRLVGVTCIRNELGSVDASGRRNPVPVAGSEFTTQFDTLIVTIGDVPDIDFISSMGIEVTEKGAVRYDKETLCTSRPGVFAGGDVVTGPNTVVRAIAAGKRAAQMIDRYVRGETLKQPEIVKLPQAHVEPCALSEVELNQIRRAEPPLVAMEERRSSFVEVELTLSEDDARREARRCLRCDLEFTEPKEEALENVGGKVA